MVNNAQILYDVYKAADTLQDMTIYVPVYGHTELAKMVIANSVLTLYYSDGTSETYPEA